MCVLLVGQTTPATFEPHLNSLDPPSTNDGKEKPQRYKNIAKERYIISKHTNTSYDGTLNITPLERGYILEFITDDLQRQKELYDKAREEAKNKNK